MWCAKDHGWRDDDVYVGCITKEIDDFSEGGITKIESDALI